LVALSALTFGCGSIGHYDGYEHLSDVFTDFVDIGCIARTKYGSYTFTQSCNGMLCRFMALLGTQTGNISLALLAGLGVSTLVLMFPWAFTNLKYAGVA